MRCRTLLATFFCSWMSLVGSLQLFAQQDGFERPPIDYMNAEVHDPVALLAAKLKAGEVSLDYDKTFGYLKSVLKALDVPVSSQTLVFSKTSLQLQRISPRRPRSLYFNDDVYVGYWKPKRVCQQVGKPLRGRANRKRVKNRKSI